MKVWTSIIAGLLIFAGVLVVNADQKDEAKATESKKSLYEQIGGQKSIDAAVDIFYKKVLADKKVNHFFEDVNMKRQIKRQKQFLGSALGGPIEYEGKTMEKAHKGLNLKTEHFLAIAGHLQATLKELKVDPKLIGQIMTHVGSLKSKVLNK